MLKRGYYMGKIKQKYTKKQINLLEYGFPKVPTTLKIGKGKKE